MAISECAAESHPHIPPHSATSPGVPVLALAGLAQPDMAFVKVWLLMNKCQHLLVCKGPCKHHMCVCLSCKLGKQEMRHKLFVLSPFCSALWRIYSPYSSPGARGKGGEVMF